MPTPRAHQTAEPRPSGLQGEIAPAMEAEFSGRVEELAACVSIYGREEFAQVRAAPRADRAVRIFKTCRGSPVPPPSRPRRPPALPPATARGPGVLGAIQEYRGLPAPAGRCLPPCRSEPPSNLPFVQLEIEDDRVLQALDALESGHTYAAQRQTSTLSVLKVREVRRTEVCARDVTYTRPIAGSGVGKVLPRRHSPPRKAWWPKARQELPTRPPPSTGRFAVDPADGQVTTYRFEPPVAPQASLSVDVPGMERGGAVTGGPCGAHLVFGMTTEYPEADALQVELFAPSLPGDVLARGEQVAREIAESCRGRQALYEVGPPATRKPNRAPRAPPASPGAPSPHRTAQAFI